MNFSLKLVFVTIIVTWLFLLCDADNYVETQQIHNKNNSNKKRKKRSGIKDTEVSDNEYNYYKIGSAIQNLLNPIIINWKK